MYRSLWLFVLVGIALVSRSEGDSYLPKVVYDFHGKATPHKLRGECHQVWRRKEFQSKKDSPPYLFQVRKGETRQSAQARYQSHYQQFKRNECWKQWTVIVYLAMDNDLMPFGYRNIKQMEQIGSSASVDIIVYIDDMNLTPPRELHIAKHQCEKKERNCFWKEHLKQIQNWVKTDEGKEFQEDRLHFQEKEYLFEKGPALVQSPDIQFHKNEVDSGDIQVAGDFLRRAIQRYPSKRTMVMVGTHGQGFSANVKKWRQKKSESVKKQGTSKGRQGGIAFDLESGNHISLADAAFGLFRLTQELRGGNRFDIVWSDACLMEQVEVALALQNAANFNVGSANLLQARGSNYSTLLRYLTSRPKISTNTIVTEMIELYKKTVSTDPKEPIKQLQRGFVDPKATMAAWNTSYLPEVRQELNHLAELLLQWIYEPKSLGESVGRIERFKKQVIKPTYRYEHIASDLYHFLLNIDVWALDQRQAQRSDFFLLNLTRLSQILKKALGTPEIPRAVHARHVGTAYRSPLGWTIAAGVAIWFPLYQEEYREMFSTFRYASQLYRDPKEDFKRPGDKTTQPSAWAYLIESLWANRSRLTEIKKVADALYSSGSTIP